jgi:predicted Fe-Mo cluster-binding NifX family protein
MQLIPVKGSAFENMELTSIKEINELRKTCGEHLKQMYHCRQCRADAIGTLDDDRSIEYRGCGSDEIKAAPKAKKYAVATKSGMLVDQHFGQATEFYIYESDGNTLRFSEKRSVSKYCTGSDDCLDDKEGKIEAILAAVSDCDAVLALRIGNSPSKKLEAMGIRIVTTYDRIEDAVKKAASE